MPYPSVMTSDRDTAAEWTSDDYVLRRDFCSVDQIRSRLDALMTAQQMKNAIVLAFDKNAVFRNLTFWRLEDSALRDAVTSHNHEFQPNQGAFLTEQPFWGVTTVDALHPALVAASDESNRFLGHSHNFYAALKARHLQTPWRISPTRTRASSLAQIELLLLSDTESHDEESLLSIRKMINGTELASLNRDSKVITKVNQALASRGTWKERTEALVAMSLDVTSSAGAALYAYSVSGFPRATLELVASRTRLEPAIVPQTPLPLSPKSDSDIARAFTTGRAVISHSSATHNTGIVWPPQDVERTEISLAIPSSGNGPNLGILTLFKPEGSYSEYDIALLRNVTLRIAATQMYARMIELVERSDSAISSLIGAGDVEDRSGSIERYVSAEGAAMDVRGLPIDLSQAAREVADDLARVGLLANSHSATLRLVLPSPEDPSTYLLRRVIAWPERRLDEEALHLRIDESSVNGWVALHGREVSIHDFRGGRPSKQYPRLKPHIVTDRRSISEYCLPIRVDRRVIGTVNFESPTPGSFEGFTQLLKSAASQFAARVVGARLAHARDVLGVTEDLTASAHALINLKERFEGLASSESPYAAMFVDAMKELESVASSIEPQRADDLPDLESPTLFDEFIRTLAIDTGITVRLDLKSRHDWVLNWPSTFYRRLRLALGEVMKNMVRNSASAIPEIRTGSVLLGHRKHHEVQIVQRHPLTVGPDIPRLYRVPIPGDDRLHFGAFAAGELMRRLGGDIVVSSSPLSSQLTIHVSIPVEGSA